MTNEELKKKIAAIIEASFDNRCRKTHCRNCDLSPDEMCQPNMYADALIAAGIGDVKETKFECDHYWRMWQGALVELEREEHRAKVAERAVENLSYKRAKILLYDDSKTAMEKIKQAELRQAEKELAEEGKDD